MEDTPDKTVSVIIVTCGINNYIKPCLDSLKNQTYPVIETIVIDNSLKKDFSRQILDSHPFIKLYSSPENLFYSKSLNRGIELSKGDFILCLNDDATMEPRFIEEALKGFSVNPKVGMVSGKILRRGGHTIDSSGLFLSVWRTAGERGYGAEDKGQYEKESYIFGVNGAAAFYLRKMLEEIKEGDDYFDSDFSFFYEDLDMAWRAQRFGWRCYYMPAAVAYHLRGGSARTSCGIDKPYARKYLDDSLHAHLIKNRYLTVIKNESLPGFILHLPLMLLYDIVMWCYILFFRPKQIKMFISNLNYLKLAFAKRKYRDG